MKWEKSAKKSSIFESYLLNISLKRTDIWVENFAHSYSSEVSTNILQISAHLKFYWILNGFYSS